LLLGAATLVMCLALPPLMGFAPQTLAGLALAALGVVLAMLPRSVPWVKAAHAVGVALLWGVLAWCILSQPAPLTQPLTAVWGLRALPIAGALAVWLWARLPLSWQRRTTVAVMLPTLLGLGLVVHAAPPRPLNFQPYYVAVDSRGTLYVVENETPEVRVFAPDGALRAKLRVGLASVLGPPGPGFSPPGPLDDPLGIGTSACVPGYGTGVGPSLGSRSLPPSCSHNAAALAGYDIGFCGLAVDGRDRLYVPDTLRGHLLRFAPDGTLQVRWPLPAAYHATRNCVAAAGDALYLSDDGGSVYSLDAAGRAALACTLPGSIPGGLTVAPDGRSLYALGERVVYHCDLATKAVSSWPLPTPTGSLGVPFQAALALGGGRLLVTDLAAHRVDVFCGAGTLCGHLGTHGTMPGQFGQVGGLARDAAGSVYVADFDSRVVQRFAPSGRIAALYWSPEDDEVD
jgi:sugar lactone lactonase YvrE